MNECVYIHGSRNCISEDKMKEEKYDSFSFMADSIMHLLPQSLVLSHQL